MGSLLHNRICDSIFPKVSYALLILTTLLAPIDVYSFASFFQKIEQSEISFIPSFIENLRDIEPGHFPKILEGFLEEFNDRYGSAISKEQWKEITLAVLEQADWSLAKNRYVLETIEFLLKSNYSEFRCCNYNPNDPLEGKVEDTLAVGCVGLLIAGLVGSLGLVFPPAYAAAGAIATYSLAEIGSGVKDQSDLNRQKKNGSYHYKIKTQPTKLV